MQMSFSYNPFSLRPPTVGQCSAIWNSFFYKSKVREDSAQINYFYLNWNQVCNRMKAS